MLLALLLQVATSASAAPPPRFSILAQPCAAARRDGKDVVVCATDPASTDRLPLPDDAPPARGYVKPDSRDYRDNKGAGGSCAASMSGCQVGFGPPIVPMVAAAVNGLKNAAKDRREAAARRRDGDRRVPIALDAPGSPGRLEP